MNELLEMYQELGISPAVYHRGRRFWQGFGGGLRSSIR